MNKKHLPLSLGLILMPLCCYLEWGKSNYMFLGEFEYKLLTGQWSADAMTHPLVLLPVIGQLFLLVSLFTPKYKWLLMIIGTVMLSILVYFLFFIGIMTMNWKTIFSSLPFVILSLWFWREYASARKAGKFIQNR